MFSISGFLKGEFGKMASDGSMVAGVASAAAVSFTLPAWITTNKIGWEQGILILILLLVFQIDRMAGKKLAKMSPVLKKTSDELNDSSTRNGIIIIICVAMRLIDFLFGWGCILYTIVTAAFIWHNFYSFVANLAVLGWEERYPMWLINWLSDEIERKKDKYFLNRKKKQIEEEEK